MNYIEQWGSGIKRIKSSCINRGLKEPLIEESGDFVNVEILREVPEGAGKMPESAGEVPERYKYLSGQEEIIINYVSNNNKITTKEVVKILDIKDRRARKILKDMVYKNLS